MIVCACVCVCGWTEGLGSALRHSAPTGYGTELGDNVTTVNKQNAPLSHFW